MTQHKQRYANFSRNTAGGSIASGYSVIFGGATNTYANLITNDVNIVTNSAGNILEVWE